MPQLQLVNNSQISPVETLSWTPVELNFFTTLRNYVINIYTNPSATILVYTATSNVSNYTIPVGVLQPLTHYWIVITAVVVRFPFITSRVVGGINSVQTKSDEFSISFDASQTQIISSVNHATVDLTWSFLTVPSVADAYIEPADTFLNGNVIDVSNEVEGSKTATIHQTTIFTLRLKLDNGRTLIRQTIVYFIYNPVPLIEGEFDVDSVGRGEHVVIAEKNYIVTLNPERLSRITLFFNFIDKGRNVTVNVSDTINISPNTILPISIPIRASFLPNKLLHPRKGVSASWGYTALTDSNLVLENNQVESFKYINLRPVPVGGTSE